jgi:ubiquinone/menaquinone biosynthesis C-methylase UbiE
MKDRLLKSDIERLRSPELRAQLEIERVVELCLEKLFVTKVLDIGSGIGLFSEAFALRNLMVTGIDTNPTMVKVAQDLVINASFKEAAAEMLPFKDKSFDVVFMALILNKSSLPQQVLEEARRVAKYRVTALEWPCRSEDDGPPLEHRLTPEFIKKIAHRAGCIQLEKIELNSMVLYRMRPK